MKKAAGRELDWTGLPVIATVARLLCREVTLQKEYLHLENRMLRDKLPGRLHFTDQERRSLAEAALAMGRSLMQEVVTIVKPETILAWQQRLEQRKWDYSSRRHPDRSAIPMWSGEQRRGATLGGFHVCATIERLRNVSPLHPPDPYDCDLPCVRCDSGLLQFRVRSWRRWPPFRSILGARLFRCPG